MVSDTSPERPSPLWRTGIHEAGHVLCDRLLGFELAGVTVVAGPNYSGLAWGPGSTRARRGKAAYDAETSEQHDAVAPRIAAVLSRCLPGPGESPESTYDIFANTQAKCVGLMGGGAAETAILGDVVPGSVESDASAANELAKVICRSAASRSAFLEYAFQEAVAIIEQYKPVVLALAQALIDHPEHTLNAEEIDVAIATALAREAQSAEQARRAVWRATTERAIQTSASCR